jgi:hypothetical protein
MSEPLVYEIHNEYDQFIHGLEEGVMPRRGHSTTIGKFAKISYDRRRSEIRRLGDLLRYEQRSSTAVANRCLTRVDAVGRAVMWMQPP